MKRNKMKCKCAVCNSSLFKSISETELHSFLGTNSVNSNSYLSDFESDIVFESVTHWDVGYTDKARYYIYRDSEGSAVAWYDVINFCGFKSNNLN